MGLFRSSLLLDRLQNKQSENQLPLMIHSLPTLFPSISLVLVLGTITVSTISWRASSFRLYQIKTVSHPQGHLTLASLSVSSDPSSFIYSSKSRYWLRPKPPGAIPFKGCWLDPSFSSAQSISGTLDANCQLRLKRLYRVWVSEYPQSLAQ